MFVPAPEGKPRLLWLTLLLILGALSGVHAQLTADFVPSKTGGCSPLAVIFTNTTTGASPSATYTWSFGNGNTITTTDAITPVAATYAIGKAYTVTLLVTDGGLTSQISVVINVYKTPSVNFTFSGNTGCQPLTTSFLATAIPGDGFITGFFWDFGDGHTVSTTSPTISNVYNFPGTYTVNVTATNSFGCTGTTIKPNIINVLPGVTAAFTADSTTICNLTDPISFINASTGVGALTYSWNFGDGTTSTTASPSHVYTTKGIYTVQLTVTSPKGCTNTLVRSGYINAADFSPAFSAPATGCTGSAVSFQDISSPPSSKTAWDFGDGQFGAGNSAGHTYAASGIYTVNMTSSFGFCQATATQPLLISTAPLLPGFVMDNGLSCMAPMTVNFSDTSSGAVKWHWQFTANPADSSDLQNPSFFYNSASIFNPKLTITNASGCQATVSEPLNTSQRTAMIKMDTTLSPSATICANVTAQFSAITKDTISTYLWDFGDGTSSTLANPVHFYNTAGTFIINLSFTTNHGCTGIAFPPDTLIVYPKPHATFNAQDSLHCVSNQLELFTNLDDSSARNFWIYGDGSSDVNNLVNHTHGYNLPGAYNMTLIASSPGCAPDTATLTRNVIAVPVPNLTAVNTCDTTRMTVTFNDTTTGASKYIWNYGDGQVDSSNLFIPQQLHTYAQPGAYTATLTAYFGACLDSVAIPVYTLRPQHPILTALQDTICESSPLPVQIAGLDTNYQRLAQGSGTYYNLVSWQYSDGTKFNPQGNTGMGTSFNGSLNGLRPGQDTLRAILQSKYFSCYDTSNYIAVHISGPLAGFSVADHLCRENAVVFTDTSKAMDGIAIVKWQWDLGDGTIITKTTPDTVMHVYAFPGKYKAQLTVTDSVGCAATVGLGATNVIVNGPKADFFWSPPGVMLGSPMTFFNSSTKGGTISYLWHFSSDGFTSTAGNSLMRTYLSPVRDTIMLIATSSGPPLCADTAIQILVVPRTTADFTFTTNYIDKANCPPMVAYFTSQTFNATSLHWDFGDGSSADNNPTPSHTYTRSGVYLVSLTAYGPGGQSTTSEDSITVKGPFAILRADVLQACIPALETLHATTTGVFSYIWDYGDGNLLGTTDTISHHTYVIPGIYYPALVISDSSGCQVNFPLGDSVIMDSLHVKLGPDSVLCNPASIQFMPSIYSMVRDSLQEVLGMHWNFGTGNPADTSTAVEPVFQFTGRGQFLVQLQVNSPPGCVAQVTDTITIAQPFSMQVPDSAVICPGASASLTVGGAATYTWLPDPTLHDISGGSAKASPAARTVYSVIGYDKTRCFADTSSIVVNIQPFPTVTMDPVISIPGGSSVALNNTVSSDVVSWSWSPADFLSCTTCPVPTATPAKPFTYVVKVTNAAGCSALDTVVINLTCSEKAVHIPNAFTPNGDGNNDLFYPIGVGIKMFKYFQVFSRWGELLFSRSDIGPNDKSLGWNGTLNGIKQPSGTYVYMVEAVCFTGETFFMKGTVELLR